MQYSTRSTCNLSINEVFPNNASDSYVSTNIDKAASATAELRSQFQVSVLGAWAISVLYWCSALRGIINGCFSPNLIGPIASLSFWIMSGNYMTGLFENQTHKRNWTLPTIVDFKILSAECHWTRNATFQPFIKWCKLSLTVFSEAIKSDIYCKQWVMDMPDVLCRKKQII